jgi:putative peptidoglycan lipid II flippase
MAFLALGDVIVAALFQTGRFTHADSVDVWRILAGSAVGLLASTLGRLYSSTYYALRDTRTPLNYAILRVVLTTALGYVCALPLPRAFGLPLMWGTAGLTASAGVAGWVEMLMLRATLNRRIGHTGLPASFVGTLWGSAIAAAAIGWAIKLALPPLHPVIAAGAVLGGYGAVYIGATIALRVPEASAATRRILRRRA